MEEEATSAVSQAYDQTFLPLELRIISPDLQVEVVPIALQESFLELSPGERWRLTPLEDCLELARLGGTALAESRGVSTANFELRPGEQAGLLDRSLWLVDTRSPTLATLEGLSGEYSGKCWDLGYRPYRIGRRGSTRHNDLEINHATVSRVQATLTLDPNGDFEILCETSASPVKINSQMLEPHTRRRLNNGDVLQLGELSFRYRKTLNNGAPNYFPSDGSLPDCVGKYSVVGLLGSGAMGVVYEGRDPNGGEVAIKIPLPNLLKDQDFVHRFNREVKLGKSLNHPRLTKILYYERAGGGSYPYLVMEKLRGHTLEHAQLPLSPATALDWMHQLLDALCYLHAQGVVHRDLKPANLFMTDQGLKVADLGIAHDSGTLANLTQTGTVLGTPAYLDPTMLRGEPCDARSDLYSAGVVLYEWLAGTLPYPKDMMQILRMKLSDDLPPIDQVNPQVPPAVASYVDRLVHPEREGRFDTAVSAREALEKLTVS